MPQTQDTLEQFLRGLRDSSGHRFVAALNQRSMPGYEFRYEDGHVREFAVDDRALDLLLSFGLEEAEAHRRFHLLSEHGFEDVNFLRFTKRVHHFQYLFNHLRIAGNSEPIPAVVTVTHDSYLNAGVWPLTSGEHLIIVNGGLINLQRWCLYRQFVQEHLPAADEELHDRLIHEMELPGLGWGSHPLKHPLTNLARIRRLLLRVALDCVGEFKLSRDYVYETRITEMALWKNHETLLRSYAEHGARAANWDTAEAFLLCHEFGHLALGHLEEARRSYSKESNSASVRDWHERRLDMEYEADAFALFYASRIQALVRNRPLSEVADPTSAGDFETALVRPIVELFLILRLTQRLVTAGQESAPSGYPDSRVRLDKLIPGLVDQINFAFWDGFMTMDAQVNAFTL